MDSKAYLVNEITDGMISIEADITIKNDLIRISLKEQRITICVKKETIRELIEK